MPDKGTGLAGVQVEPKPAGSEQGEELADHEVHLRTAETCRAEEKRGTEILTLQ